MKRFVGAWPTEEVAASLAFTSIEPLLLLAFTEPSITIISLLLMPALTMNSVPSMAAFT